MTESSFASQLEAIRSNLDGATLELGTRVPQLRVSSSDIGAACKRLAEDSGLDMLHTISGVDFPDRIEIVYHLYGTADQRGLVVKTDVPRESGSLESVVSVWVTADWHERETAELYGLEFVGHPDPRNLLIADDFPGFPLRKDWHHDNLEEYLLE